MTDPYLPSKKRNDTDNNDDTSSNTNNITIPPHLLAALTANNNNYYNNNNNESGGHPSLVTSETHPSKQPKDNTANKDKKEQSRQKNGTKRSSSNSPPSNQHQSKVREDDVQEVQEEEAATFPQQLMDLIEAESTLPPESPTNRGGASVIDGERVVEWLRGGESFVIRDKKRLERDVMPRYFSAKCKFMSFVRKLYRWGFRQVEKDTRSGTMIFVHANFVRGDKRRCLLMRSIVKKPTTNTVTQQQQHAFSGLANISMNVGANLPNMNGNSSNNNSMIYPGFGSSVGGGGQYNNMDPNTMTRNAAAMFQQASHAYPAFNHQGGNNDNGIMNSASIGGGGGLYNVPNNNYSQVNSNLGMTTSSDMFQAGLRLKRMEQQQQQQPHQEENIMPTTGGLLNNENTTLPNSSVSPFKPTSQLTTNGTSSSLANGYRGIISSTASHSSNNYNNYNGTASSSSNNFGSAASSQFHPPGPVDSMLTKDNNCFSGISSSNNYNDAPSSSNNNNFGEMSQVQAAFQFMKQDPSIEPWRALEMAKQFGNQ